MGAVALLRLLQAVATTPRTQEELLLRHHSSNCHPRTSNTSTSTSNHRRTWPLYYKPWEAVRVPPPWLEILS